MVVMVALFQHTKETEINWKKEGSLERAHTHTSAMSQIAKNVNRRGYGEWRTQEFCSGEGGGEGVQQIQLRIQDREKWDLEAAAS